MTSQSELPRLVSVHEIPAAGKSISIEASDEERKRIAKRLTLQELNHFYGNIRITPFNKRQFVSEGTVSAKIVQTCVVSGEPMTTELSFELERTFEEGADIFAGLNVEDDEISDPDEEGPDPIIDGKIDIGEAAVEELALQIPPYPRLPGVVSADIIEDSVDDNDTENPFAALASLKNNLKSDN